MKMKIKYGGYVIALFFATLVSQAYASTFYVSPHGSDRNSGSKYAPFATIMAAQKAAAYGDTVYLRGGTYYPTTSDISYHQSVRAVVNHINKDGISYVNYPGERPIFNFSNVKPANYRVVAFLVHANDCVFKGFDVVGVPITIADRHTQSVAFRVYHGNNNRFENLAIHDGMAIGWYLESGSNNLVLNCDAYNNQGLNSYSVGNIDGFGAHPNSASGTGNVIRGCRAWFNSDDGFDLINASAAVTIEDSWSFYNGYDQNFNPVADGNGFKAGGYGSNGSATPSVIPRHVIKHCLAVRNRSAGFYANHHIGGQDWINNTAIRNHSANYNMLSTLADNDTDVKGYGHYMRNNLGFDGHHEVINLGDANENDIAYNYFNLDLNITSKDFLRLTEKGLVAPRQSDGSLPRIKYAKLKKGSDLIDAGTYVGEAYHGVAPDVGAFESNY